MMRGTVSRTNLAQKNARAELLGCNDELVNVITGRGVCHNDVKLEHGRVLAQNTHVIGG